MSGFPATPTRAAFGPTFQNARAVKDPEKELDAQTMNLLAWQVAGAGRVLPKVFLVYDGAADSVLQHSEAWAPRADGTAPTVVKNGTGDYTFTFAASYANENGADVAFAPTVAVPVVQGGAAGVEATAVTGGQDVQVLVKDASAVAADGKVALLVW